MKEISVNHVDDFLTFVSENDGRNFKQGSFMFESEKIYKAKDLQKIFADINERLGNLEERVFNLERDLVKIWQPPC